MKLFGIELKIDFYIYMSWIGWHDATELWIKKYYNNIIIINHQLRLTLIKKNILYNNLKLNGPPQQRGGFSWTTSNKKKIKKNGGNIRRRKYIMDGYLRVAQQYIMQHFCCMQTLWSIILCTVHQLPTTITVP